MWQLPAPSSARILPVLFLLAAAFVAWPADAALGVTERLIGYDPSYELRAEDFWTQPPVFEVCLTGLSTTTPEFFESAPVTATATYVAQTIAANTTVPEGLHVHKQSIFTAVARNNITCLHYTPAKSSLLTFTHPLYVDRIRFTFNAAKIGNYSGSNINTEWRSVRGLSTLGSAAFRDNASSTRTHNELAIRSTGLTIRVDLEFNDFPAAANDSLIITSSDPVLNAARSQWTVSLPGGASLPAPSLLFTLPPLPDFNISSAGWIHVRVNASRVRIGLAITPDAANFTVATIDQRPLAYCTVPDATITEAELRAAAGGGVLRAIALSPPTADAFVVGNRTVIDPVVLASIAAPSDLRIAVADMNTSHVVLNVTALLGAAYDTDVPFPITIVLNAALLVSAEAGCGQTFISVVPSPGIVTGVRNVSQLTFTELDINDGDLDLEFTVAFDKFVTAPTYDAVATLSPADATAGGAEYFGYAQTMQGSATVTLLGVSRDRVVVRFPRSARYNIPFESTETINISFPGAAVVSGVVPTMQRSTLNVTGVTPTFNVSFDGNINQGTVTAKQLWSTGANMSLNLRGDTWDVDGRNLWNVNHPRLEGSIKRGDELYSMQQTIDRMGGLANVVDYANVNITLRSATLPLFPLPGLSVRTDERVRVQKLSQLILGRPTVAQENFDVVQIQSQDLRVTFGGAGTPGRVIGEKDFRNGFWVSMTLNFNVFKVNSTQWFRELFPTTSSLTPFLDTCNATREPAWVYNFSCPAMPTFDIDNDELIPMAIPAGFYYEVLPVQQGTATIGVIAAPSPTCVWNADFSFTEGDIRNVAAGGFFVEVRSTEPFDADADKLNMTVGTIVKSTHQAAHPINITVKPRFLPLFLQLVIQPDAAYEIDTNDVVTVHLDRFFFDIRERCNALNFTVNVLPGTGYGTNVSTNAPESWVRDGNVSFTLTLLGERAVGPEFDFVVSVTYPPVAGQTGPNRATKTIGVTEGLASYGFKEALGLTTGGSSSSSTFVVRAHAITNWTDTTQNATVFAASLPRLPSYKLLQPENITLAIPGTAVASGVPPVLRDNSFVFYPAPSRVNFTFNTTLEEDRVTRGGGEPLRIQLLDDYWNATTAPGIFRDTMRRTAPDGGSVNERATGSLLAIFNLAAFAFPTPDVMEITMSGDPAYDAPEDELFVLGFTGAMTASGVQPAVTNISLHVVAGVPRLVASGSALKAGSRDFIQGGLSLLLYLENDLFVQNALLPSDVCPFGACAVSVDNNGRTLTVNLQANTETVLVSNATFTVFIKPSAVRSNATLNNVTLEIALEPGIATLAFADAPTTVTEQEVAEGKLPALLLNVIGDRFVNDAGRLARALAAGTVCFPASDAYGFCGRAQNIFATIDVRFFTLQTVQLTLQADELFDVAANERINITIGALGTESGLAPTGWVSLTITPVRGRYYFSSTASAIPSARLTSQDDLDVTVTLTLRHERFTAYPTAAVIAGSRSALTSADEPQGYDRWKTEMYHEGVLSADQRTLRLSMRRTPLYAARSDETITFAIPADAVRSSTPPALASENPATVVIERSGGRLTLESPSVTTAARVRYSGVNITVTSTDRWQAVFISGLSPSQIRGSITSNRAPAQEPFGFEALKSAMLSRTIIVESNRLDLAIAPSPAYALDEDEVITFTFTDPRWGSLNRPMVPDRITILVKAKQADDSGALTFYVTTPVDEGELQRGVAAFAGITTDRVVIVRNDVFSSGFRRVEVDVLPAPVGAPSDARRPSQVAEFFLASDADLVKRRLNTSAIERQAAPLDSDTLLLRLGIRTERRIVREEQSLVWLWVSIAALALAAIAAVVIYHYRLKGRMLAPQASDARSAPLLKIKGSGLDQTFVEALEGKAADEGSAMHDGNNSHNGYGFNDDGWGGERGARLSPSPGRSASPDEFASASSARGVSRARGGRPATADAALDELLATSAGRARPIAANPAAAFAASSPGNAPAPVAAIGGTGAAGAVVAPFTDDDTRVAGPSLAGRRARDVRIDLDEYVATRQPGSFLRPTAGPLELPPLQRVEGPTGGVALYPPGTPASRKFRTKTVDTRYL